MPHANMKTPSTKKGYTLLFAVIVATIVLGIATFILSISRKQFILSSTARDSTVAIYAADGGIECAAENLGSGLATSSYSGRLPACGSPTGSYWQVFSIYDTSGHLATTSFYMPASSVNGVAPAAAPCVWVQVGQWYSGSGSIVTSIESRGYNIGWNPSTQDCSVNGPRKVERALRLRYGG